MGKFKNEFSWSISRDRDFQLCKRKYFLSRYAFWGGWEESADKTTRKIYILKNQISIPMLVGKAVHKTIERTLNSLKSRKLSLDEAKRLAIGHFKKGWRESRNEEWKSDPKRKVNLFEHYYKEVPAEQELKEVGAIINTNVENFFSSDSFKFIQSIKPLNWLSIELMESFKINGETVWCVIDFALKDNGRVFIYDWKTGKKITEDERQLAVYSLYAMNKWTVDLQDIRLFDVYLRINTPVKVKVSSSLIDETLLYINQSANEMKSLLDNVEKNTASIENFPKIDNINICLRCSFKEICYPEGLKQQ